MAATGARRARQFPHGRAGARAEDDAFEQRIAGQAVGAVHAGAGHFARREQARQTGRAVEVRCARRPWRSAPPDAPGAACRSRSTP